MEFVGGKVNKNRNRNVSEKENTNNKQKILIKCFIILIPLIFIVLIAFHFENTTSVKEGTFYYCTNGSAYTYNVKTKIKKEVKIKGYDKVSWYYPEKDGYIAYVCNDEDNAAIIRNGEVIIKVDSYLTHLTKNGDYVFYIKNDYHLNAVNIKTRKNFTVSKSVYYGYSFVGNYLYFSEQNPNKTNSNAAIKTANCSNNELNVVTIDNGILYNNSENKLIYSKGKQFYLYDFDLNKSVVIKDAPKVDDNYNCRFIGSMNIGLDSYTIYLKQKILFSKNVDYYNYENDLMKGVFLPTKEHLQIFPRLEIKGENGRLIIPVKRLDSSAERYSVTAYENNGELYYVNQTRLKWIY